jgi:hypothetical protein
MIASDTASDPDTKNRRHLISCLDEFWRYIDKNKADFGLRQVTGGVHANH